MTIQQAEQLLAEYSRITELLAKLFEKVEVHGEKVDKLADAVERFAEQVEESVVRIEDAAREPRDDY